VLAENDAELGTTSSSSLPPLLPLLALLAAVAGRLDARGDLDVDFEPQSAYRALMTTTRGPVGEFAEQHQTPVRLMGVAEADRASMPASARAPSGSRRVRAG
jgi:hypothetical protein